MPEEVAEAKDDSVGNALLLGNALEEGNEGNAEELDEVLKLELGLPVTLEEDKEEGLVVALAVADGEGGRFFKRVASIMVNARLYTRISLNEPEKTSPVVLLGNMPFQPRRRVEEDKEEISNIEMKDETLDPSM